MSLAILLFSKNVTIAQTLLAFQLLAQKSIALQFVQHFCGQHHSRQQKHQQHFSSIALQQFSYNVMLHFSCQPKCCWHFSHQHKHQQHFSCLALLLLVLQPLAQKLRHFSVEHKHQQLFRSLAITVGYTSVASSNVVSTLVIQHFSVQHKHQQHFCCQHFSHQHKHNQHFCGQYIILGCTLVLSPNIVSILFVSTNINST